VVGDAQKSHGRTVDHHRGIAWEVEAREKKVPVSRDSNRWLRGAGWEVGLFLSLFRLHAAMGSLGLQFPQIAQRSRRDLSGIKQQ